MTTVHKQHFLTLGSPDIMSTPVRDCFLGFFELDRLWSCGLCVILVQSSNNNKFTHCQKSLKALNTYTFCLEYQFCQNEICFCFVLVFFPPTEAQI